MGYVIGTVERHIHSQDRRGPGFKKDLLGCIDMLALRPGRVLAVQSTGQDWSGHWKKILAGSGRTGALVWLETGQPLILIGWRELKSGWSPRIHWFLPSDFNPLLEVPMNYERGEEEWERSPRYPPS